MRNRFFPDWFTKLSAFWIFPVSLLIVAWFYNFDHIMFLGPQSMHFWRQTDCLSFVENFMMENRGLFNPALNYIGTRGDGQVASDFPLIYYFVGKLWNLFGQHEWIYRLLVFVLFSTAISIFFNSLRRMLNDNIWAVYISLLLFTSPVIAYYSCNFLINIPAFSLGLIGLSCFYLFYKSGKSYLLWLSCLAYLLGGLIKIPALITFVILCFIYLTEVVGLIKYKNEGKIFNKLDVLPILMVIVPILLWLIYINHYNKGNEGIFLVGIYPIWELNTEQIKNIINVFFEFWYKQHFSPILHVVTIILFLWIFINIKRIKPIIRTYFILATIGVILFILVWFQAQPNHDYYLTDTYILFLIVWAVAIKILLDKFPVVMKSVWVKVFFLGFLLYNIHYCEKEINLRYNGWPNDYFKKYQSLVELKPKLREMGISRLDTVIVMGDETINGSLYLLDQKGWTNYGGHMNNLDSTKIDLAIKSGARYMILLDSIWQEKDFVKPFIHHQILQKDAYKVFKLK